MDFPSPHHNHEKCTADLISKAERACVGRGSKLTGQRREVLACVGQSHAAVGAYDIIERMAKKGPRPAPITVYRALDFLMAHGLIHKVESRNAFVACCHSHEGVPAVLMVCTGCGTVAELEVPEALAAMDGAARQAGFRPERLVIEMSGQCRGCREAH